MIGYDGIGIHMVALEGVCKLITKEPSKSDRHVAPAWVTISEHREPTANDTGTVQHCTNDVQWLNRQLLWEC